MTGGTFGGMEIDWIESLVAWYICAISHAVHGRQRKAGYTGECFCDETHPDDTEDKRSIVATSQ